MVRLLCCTVFFLSVQLAASQQLTGQELLNRSIQYHDPESNWNSFVGAFEIMMTTADASKRSSHIEFNFPARFFSLEVEQGNNHYKYHINKDSCEITFNGSSKISSEVLTKYRLSCDRGMMYRDYYSYLYGLPMKLKDPGTEINPTVKMQKFKGKTYLRLKVTYDAKIGEDTWYFFFDPKTYSMEVYQFFHDEAKNDGEYILLSGQETVNGIKMPKHRAWYYNKNDGYLGTDILIK